MKLIDSFGRQHTSLRLSVTDRCNVRCFYCMPSEHIEFLPRPEILTFEELTRVTEIFAGMGITKIRLTGGEPLVRKHLHRLIEQLRQIESIEEIALTTNAILLADQAAALRQAGLDRINVSLDTLDRQQFAEITRRDELDRVLQGIEAAQSAGFDDIRINAVAVKGMIEAQIIPLVRFAAERGLVMRFIEFMPLNAEGQWSNDEVLGGADIRFILEQEYGPLIPVPRPDPAQPATDFQFAESPGKVGFINSVTEPFCGDCNRLRLTADGKIHNCLFSNEEWDVRDLLRSGADVQSIADLIVDCVAHKKAAHGIGTAEFSKPRRAMYQIGG